MTTDALPEQTTGVLDAVLRRAGAVFGQRHGRGVVVSYGSSAGELAACVCAAGIADASALIKLELTGRSGPLRELVRHATGSVPAPGGCLHVGGAWWCSADAERMIVLGESRLGARLGEHLSTRAARRPGCQVRDRTGDWAAISVLGPATTRVLASLGVFGPAHDPRAATPFTSCPLAGTEVLWLLESEHRAIALVPGDHADAAWREIERGGRPERICCVGQDAVDRYTLLERHVA